MIVFQSVSKIYPNKTAALDDVSFTIEPQEFVSLVGRSGAGKSTIVKLLIGEERPSKGRVMLAGAEINKVATYNLPKLRRQIGTVFQDFRLLPAKTAYENIAFAMEVAGRPEDEIVDLVPKALDIVGLADKAEQFPHELSGGEKQRVAIARAMIQRPPVLIADEPTGNLDPVNTTDIIKLLLKINELGTTVILATHSRDVVNSIRRRVILLENGRLVRDDKQGTYIL